MLLWKNENLFAHKIDLGTQAKNYAGVLFLANCEEGREKMKGINDNIVLVLRTAVVLFISKHIVCLRKPLSVNNQFQDSRIVQL